MRPETRSARRCDKTTGGCLNEHLVVEAASRVALAGCRLRMAKLMSEKVVIRDGGTALA